MQVHAGSETERQRGLKRALTEASSTLGAQLGPTYDVRRLTHPVAAKRVLVRDHARFLGLASVVFGGVDMVVDIEQYADDYMTAFQVVRF